VEGAQQKEVHVVFTVYDWIYGVAQIAAGVLAIIGGGLSIEMFRSSAITEMRAWRFVLLGLIFFILEEIIGGLRTFGIVPSTGVWSFIVHVIVTGILGFLIAALVVQLQINRGWLR
jgi:hypothetical protein